MNNQQTVEGTPLEGIPLEGIPIEEDAVCSKKYHTISGAIKAVVLLLLLGVFAVALFQGLEKARRLNRSKSTRFALKLTKSFKTKATAYARANNGKFWENGTTDFGAEFANSEKFGLSFYYFSNDENIDGKHEATSYVFLAVPLKNRGNELVAVDESNDVFTAVLEKTDFETRPNGELKIKWSEVSKKYEDADMIIPRIPGYKWKKEPPRQ